MMALPVVVSPVNAMAPMPGCRAIASPAESLPKPCTTLITPSGTPAWAQISASTVAVMGVHSAGFRTTVFPMARAGASLALRSSRGRFQGLIRPTTPTGRRTT